MSFVWSSGSATVCFPPIADFTINPNTVCPNDPINIKNNSCKNFPQTTFAWTMPGASPFQTSIAETPATFTYPTGGTYTVTLVMNNPTNPPGCRTSTHQETVTVSPPATAVFTMPTQGCVGEVIAPITNNSQNATAPPGQSPYLWSATQISGPPGGMMMFIAPSTSGDKEPKFKFTKKGTYRVRLDVKGCGTPSVVHEIVIRDKPSITPNLPTNKCAPYALTLSAANWAFDAGDFPMSSLTYSWKITKPGGAMTTSTDQYPPPILCDVAGTYTIAVTVTNDCGSTPFSMEFKVGQVMDVNFTYPAQTDSCIGTGKTIVFANTSTGTNPMFQMPTVTGGPAGGAAVIMNLPTGFSITFSKAGTYTVSWTGSNGCPSTDTHTATLVFFDKPKITAFTIVAPCEGELLSVSPPVVDNGGLPCDCIYTFGGGAPVTLPCGQTPPKVPLVGIGPHTVTVKAKNRCGESAVETRTFSFSRNPVLSILIPDKVCLPGQLVCTDQSQYFTGGNAPTLRKWTLRNAAGQVVDMISNTATASFSPPGTGSFMVELQAGNGCDTLSTSKTVQVYASPTAFLSLVSNNPCGSGTPSFTFTFTEGGAPASIKWTWVNADGTPDMATGATPPAPFFDKPGSYTFTVTVSNGQCPDVVKSVTFTVDPIPSADVQATALPKCLDPDPAKNRIKFELPALSGVGYQRDIKPATGWHYVNGDKNSASAEIEIDQCGIYTYTATASNHCDTKTWTRTDTFYQAPKATPQTLQDACQHKVIDFAATLIDLGCDPNAKVNWDFGPTATPSTSTDMHPSGIAFDSPDKKTTVVILLRLIGTCDTLVYPLSFTLDVPETPAFAPNPLENCEGAPQIDLSIQGSSGWQFFWNNQPIPPKFPPPGFPIDTPGKIVAKKATPTCNSEGFIEGIVHPKPTATLGPDITVCVEIGKALLPFTTNAPKHVWTSDNPDATIVGDTAYFSKPLTATLTLTLTSDHDCTNSYSLKINVVDNTPPLVPSLFLLCNTAGAVRLPLTADNPKLEYTGIGVTADKRHFNPKAAGVGTSNLLTWTNTNDAGCTSGGTMTVELKELLSPPPSAGLPAVICQNSGTVFSRDAVPNLPGMEWLDLAGKLYSSNGTLSFDPAQFSRDTFLTLVLAYLRGSPNCDQFDTVTFHIVFAAPNAGPDITNCVNDPPFQLTPANAPPPGFSFHWSPSDMLDPAQGDQTATLHFTAWGCVFTDDVLLKVRGLAGSAFALVPPYCTGQVIDFKNTTPGADSQKWFDNGAFFSDAIDPQGVVLSAGWHTIRLESWTGEGCHDSFEVKIYVESPPMLICSPDTKEGCGPLPVTFTYSATGDDELFFEVWLNGALLWTEPATGSPQTLKALPDAPTDVTYTVRLVARNECYTIVCEHKILVKARAKAGFSTNKKKFCNHEVLRILDKSINSPMDTLLINGVKYPISATQIDSFLMRNETKDSIVLRVCLIAGNDCNRDTFCTDIVIYPNEYEALAEIAPPILVKYCEDATVQLIGHTTPGATSSWRNLRTNAVYFGANLSVKAEAGENVYVLYAEGCGFDTDTVRFFGTPSPPLTLDFLPNACPGEPMLVKATTSPNAGVAFVLSPNDTLYGSPAQWVSWVPGRLAFSVFAISSPERCTTRVDTALTVRPTPPIPVTLTERCTQFLGYDLTIDDTGMPSVWVTSDSGVVKTGYDFTRLQPGHYRIHLVDKFTCENDTVVVVPKVREVSVKVTPPRDTILLGESVELFAEGEYADSIRWSRAEWLNGGATSFEPLATPEKTGCFPFVATVTDDRGCTASDTAIICVTLDKVVATLPSGFTPNGDGRNDILVARSNKPGVVRMEFWVYDEDGSLVFRAAEGCLPNDPENSCGWDGSFRGHKAEMGNYRAFVIFYYLNGETSEHPKIVRLIR